MVKRLLLREDLLYPELSYQIIGILFDIHNRLGYGHSERSYQRAVALGLKNSGLRFREQVYAPLFYKEQRVGSNFLDFLIESKIVLEIKRGDHFVSAHIDQIYRYLVTKNLRLGILAYFAPRKLHFRRIVNL